MGKTATAPKKRRATTRSRTVVVAKPRTSKKPATVKKVVKKAAKTLVTKKTKKIYTPRVTREAAGQTRRAPAPRGTGALLERFEGNPVVEPIESNGWESKATFNPAALYADGRIHLLYRAIGDTDVSVLGYASSKDGLHFDDRPDTPAYVPRLPFEGAHHTVKPAAYGARYISGGGGWGGCEDPRLTLIDGQVYLLYVAFDGGSPPRVALSSITLKNFLAKEWDWAEPVLISPPHVVNKNACLLPEKVGGKFVLFHRVYPDILIDFVDDLHFDGKTKWLTGQHKIKPRKKFWDSRKIGVGATPIKTPQGWLLIYQAVGEQDSGRYKMGAMLLDLHDPTRVIARSREPILEPAKWYENDGWKYGVVYPCGAVIVEGQLIVYYGGADRVVCAATAPASEFINLLLRDEAPKLRSVVLNTAAKKRNR